MSLGTKTARAWVGAGASYICAWGPDSEAVEETFDYASFLPEFGEPLPFTLMTTSHRDETPEEAFWFAFYSATPPDDLDHELTSVVIIVDSDSLRPHALRGSKKTTNRGQVPVAGPKAGNRPKAEVHQN